MKACQLTLISHAPSDQSSSLIDSLYDFSDFGRKTRAVRRKIDGLSETVMYFYNEFWEARQRQSLNLHEISYRACFKAELPRFFISRLTQPGEIVYDPFMGRGTTLLEAALLGRIPYGCDINPLSVHLVEPRLNPPSAETITEFIKQIKLEEKFDSEPEDLLAFYHPKTLGELKQLQEQLAAIDLSDQSATTTTCWPWIRMVATNRLSGHSSGFFSVYSLPPNQSVSVASQIKINEKRGQIPEYRNTLAIIQKKSLSLLKGLDETSLTNLRQTFDKRKLLVSSADRTTEIKDNSVALVVTSPPFLDVVQYTTDNWLRCWFNNIDSSAVPTWQMGSTKSWCEKMKATLTELHRIIRPGGHLAFEVGEVNKGQVKLDELIIPLGVQTGFSILGVMINEQQFTKTANCWGVDNQTKGTNTNRIVLLQKRSN
ncbi:MAG: DNA methyltransferase [bacterium]|nr:DNA methyltransferase [bacterium]